MAEQDPSEKAAEEANAGLPAGEMNPGRYRDMCVPHESSKAMNAAFTAFYDDVLKARIKHRVMDVMCVLAMKAETTQGEGEALLQFHMGDPTKGEGMAAYAYGKLKREREELISEMLDGDYPKKRRK